MYSVYSNWKTSSLWLTPHHRMECKEQLFSWFGEVTSHMSGPPPQLLSKPLRVKVPSVIQSSKTCLYFIKLLCYQLVTSSAFLFNWRDIVFFHVILTVTGTFQNKGKWWLQRAVHAWILSKARSILFTLGIHSFRLYCVDYEAEFIAQCLVSVGHADLGDIGPADIVPFRSVFQIVHS